MIRCYYSSLDDLVRYFFRILNWIDFSKKLSLHQSIHSACCDDTLMNYFPNQLTTFSDVFFSSELDWLHQKASLASVNSHTCHNEHSTQLFTLFIEYLFRCAFQFWYVLSLAKSYPCNCHFSLHVVTNTLREPCRTNIAVFFQLLSNVQETCCKFVNVCKLK